MCHRSKVSADPHFMTVITEFSLCQIGAIICDDAVRETKSHYEFFDNFFGSCTIALPDWFSFNLFGELVYDN